MNRDWIQNVLAGASAEPIIVVSHGGEDLVAYRESTLTDGRFVLTGGPAFRSRDRFSAPLELFSAGLVEGDALRITIDDEGPLFEKGAFVFDEETAMTTATSSIISIRHGYTIESLGDLEFSLIDESAANYERLLRIALEDAYPNVCVTIQRSDPQHLGSYTSIDVGRGGYRETISTVDGEPDEDAELLAVLAAIDAVWTSVDWTIPAPTAGGIFEEIDAAYTYPHGRYTSRVKIRAYVTEFTHLFEGSREQEDYPLDGQFGRATEGQWRAALRRIVAAEAKCFARYNRTIVFSDEFLAEADTLDELATMFEDAARTGEGS